MQADVFFHLKESNNSVMYYLNIYQCTISYDLCFTVPISGNSKCILHIIILNKCKYMIAQLFIYYIEHKKMSLHSVLHILCVLKDTLLSAFSSLHFHIKSTPTRLFSVVHSHFTLWEGLQKPHGNVYNEKTILVFQKIVAQK